MRVHLVHSQVWLGDGEWVHVQYSVVLVKWSMFSNGVILVNGPYSEQMR